MSSVALQGVVSGWLPGVQGVLKLVRLQHRHITYIHCCKIVLMFYNYLINKNRTSEGAVFLLSPGPGSSKYPLLNNLNSVKVLNKKYKKKSGLRRPDFFYLFNIN